MGCSAPNVQFITFETQGLKLPHRGCIELGWAALRLGFIQKVSGNQAKSKGRSTEGRVGQLRTLTILTTCSMPHPSTKSKRSTLNPKPLNLNPKH